ncbi:MAG: hypothetical protein AMJ46_02870 [Latescibacteria bacterium DG_63]|nr:MAG: hypothetical protein AMJ46_02870 [Latescibacteria bacterium DG_63]
MRPGNSVTSTVLFLLFAFALVVSSTGTGHAQKYVPSRDFVMAAAVPEPIHLEWKTQQAFPLVATTIIVVPTTSSKEELATVEWLQRGLLNFYGVNPEIMVTDLIPEQNALVLGTTANSPSLRNLLPKKAQEGWGRFPKQGYAFSCTPNGAALIGVDLQGLKHGVQTIMQIICVESYIREYVLPPLEIVDFPAHDMRALLLPLRDYRFYAQMNDARQLIDVAEMVHMNTVILQIDNAIKFDSLLTVSRSSALEKDTLRAIVQYAREAGMEVVPMINTFSHQDLLLCPAFPELCLTKEAYDPSSPEVYEKLFDIFDEILEVCKPTYVHVGHDRIWALADLPAEDARKLFLSDVKKIHAYLKNKNVQMMMWADMLLAPAECKGQDNCHGLLGNTYTLIDSLPKDIILVEAHYRMRKPEFPSTDYLLSKGFRVIGCVSDDARVANNFSRYTANKNDNFLGMIMALWGCFEYNGMGTPRRNLRTSAEAFWRGGIPPVDPKGENRPQNLKLY